MASPSKNFEVDVGTTFRFNIAGVNRGDNSPFDFSTGQVRMEFRKDATAPSADLTLSEGSGVTNNGVDGVQVELTSAQTRTLAGVRYHRLIVTVSAKDYVIMRGSTSFVY